MSDVQSELAAMVADFDTLEKALAELSEKITPFPDFLATFEATCHEKLDGSVQAFDKFEEDIVTAARPLQADMRTLLAATAPVEVEIATDTHDLETAGQKSVAEIDAAAADVDHLKTDLASHKDELERTVGHIAEHIKHLEDSLATRVQHATTTVEAKVHHLGEIGQKWTQLGVDYTGHIATSLAESTDHIDQKFIAPLDDVMHHFADLSKTIEEAVLSNPLATLSDKLRDEVIAEAHRLIDEAAKELERLLDEAIHALFEAGNGSDAVAKEIHQVVDDLEATWNSLKHAFDKITDIWDTVKNI